MVRMEWEGAPCGGCSLHNIDKNWHVYEHPWTWWAKSTMLVGPFGVRQTYKVALINIIITCYKQFWDFCFIHILTKHPIQCPLVETIGDDTIMTTLDYNRLLFLDIDWMLKDSAMMVFFDGTPVMKFKLSSSSSWSMSIVSTSSNNLNKKYAILCMRSSLYGRV